VEHDRQQRQDGDTAHEPHRTASSIGIVATTFHSPFSTAIATA
jgi:hypothetical protein